MGSDYFFFLLLGYLRVFKRYDTDGSGNVDKNNMADMLRVSGSDVTPEDVKEMERRLTGQLSSRSRSSGQSLGWEKKGF